MNTAWLYAGQYSYFDYKKDKGDVILEGLAKKIEQILFNFTRQKLGNRLSEFSTLALKEIILN